MYGGALLRRSAAVFDELKQSIRDIEFLADPTAGELKIGCPEAVAAILPPILESFAQKHPGVVLHVDPVNTATLELPGLRQRKIDLVVALLLDADADDRRRGRPEHRSPCSMITWSWRPGREAGGRVVARSISPNWSTSPGFWRRPIPGPIELSLRRSERVD